MVAPVFRPAGQSGLAMCGGLLSQAEAAPWKLLLDARYAQLGSARGGPDSAVAQIIGRGESFVATASSFTLGGVLGDVMGRALLDGIVAGAAGAWIKNELGGKLVCDLDQAWARRQYAPGRSPSMHAPHGWHQDGALKFDFAAYPDGNFPFDALLPMVTCWIALDACGINAAGLEVVNQRLPGLLSPIELRSETVLARFTADSLLRPGFEAGDALLFRGDILHRTHVTPSMTNDRTSIEVRFFSANDLPQRLRSDRFVFCG